jgi:hypothetical protein
MRKNIGPGIGAMSGIVASPSCTAYVFGVSLTARMFAKAAMLNPSYVLPSTFFDPICLRSLLIFTVLPDFVFCWTLADEKWRITSWQSKSNALK